MLELEINEIVSDRINILLQLKKVFCLFDNSELESLHSTLETSKELFEILQSIIDSKIIENPLARRKSILITSTNEDKDCTLFFDTLTRDTPSSDTLTLASSIQPIWLNSVDDEKPQHEDIQFSVQISPTSLTNVFESEIPRKNSKVHKPEQIQLSTLLTTYTQILNTSDEEVKKDLRKTMLLIQLSNSATLINFQPYLIAFRISLIQQSQFSRIKFQDLLEHIYSTNLAMQISTEFFNYLTRIVESTILSSTSLDERAECIEHWINISSALLHGRNILGCKAIVSALGTPPILRLKKTWPVVAKKYIEKLSMINKLLSEQENYKNLRAWMQENTETPGIPFFGLLIYDLTYLSAIKDRNDGVVERRYSEISNLISWYNCGPVYTLEHFSNPKLHSTAFYSKNGLILKNLLGYMSQVKNIDNESVSLMADHWILNQKRYTEKEIDDISRIREPKFVSYKCYSFTFQQQDGTSGSIKLDLTETFDYITQKGIKLPPPEILSGIEYGGISNQVRQNSIKKNLVENLGPFLGSKKFTTIKDEVFLKLNESEPNNDLSNIEPSVSLQIPDPNPSQKHVGPLSVLNMKKMFHHPFMKPKNTSSYADNENSININLEVPSLNLDEALNFYRSDDGKLNSSSTESFDLSKLLTVDDQISTPRRSSSKKESQKIMIQVQVLEARNLKAKDLNGFSDPYVVVKVGNTGFGESNVVRDSLNPTWNYSVEIEVEETNIETSCIEILCWDHDTLKSHDFLGLISIPIKKIVEWKKDSLWLPLNGRTPKESVRGDLRVLCKILDCKSGFVSRKNSISNTPENNQSAKFLPGDREPVKACTASFSPNLKQRRLRSYPMFEPSACSRPNFGINPTEAAKK